MWTLTPPYIGPRCLVSSEAIGAGGCPGRGPPAAGNEQLPGGKAPAAVPTPGREEGSLRATPKGRSWGAHLGRRRLPSISGHRRPLGDSGFAPGPPSRAGVNSLRGGSPPPETLGKGLIGGLPRLAHGATAAPVRLYKDLGVSGLEILRGRPWGGPRTGSALVGAGGARDGRGGCPPRTGRPLGPPPRLPAPRGLPASRGLAEAGGERGGRAFWRLVLSPPFLSPAQPGPGHGRSAPGA